MAENEEEISLTGRTPQTTEPQPEGQEGGEPQIKARHARLNISPQASDEDVLEQVLTVPEEQLYQYELCQVPSDGVYYGWQDGMIEVRPMTQMSEMALATARLAQTGQSFDRMLQTCCKFPQGFDPVNLLVGDRTFLMYYLRGITHGNLYEFVLTCTNIECQEASTHTYDLNELAKTIKRPNRELGTEPFRVSLPYMSEAVGRDFWVSIRFLRGYDISNMVTRYKANRNHRVQPGGINRNPLQRKQQQVIRNKELDTTIVENLAMVIVSVMGKNDPIRIKRLVDRLHPEDSNTIQSFLRDNSPGVDASIKVTCPSCGNDFTVELPFTETFFRPTKSR